MRVRRVRRKIALVLFGQPRFIDNGFAIQSHKWHFRKYEFDVYGHYWYSTESKYQLSSWTGIKNTDSIVPETAPQTIRRAFPKGTFIESPPQIFSPPEPFAHLLSDYLTSYGLRSEFERLRSDPQSMYSNTTSQLFSINQALGLVRASAKDYDLVVLSRWDNLVLRLPNLESVSADKLTISDSHDFGFPDLILIGGPKLIEATDAYPAIPEIFGSVPSMTAEKVKQANFFQRYTLADLERKRLSVSLVRGSGIKWLVKNLIDQLAIGPKISRLTPSFLRRITYKLLGRSPD